MAHAVLLDGAEFRQAQLGDASAVVALVQSAYRGEQSRKGWTTEADLLGGQRTDLAEVVDLIGRGPASVWLLTSKDHPLACICLSPVPRPEPGAPFTDASTARCVQLGMFAVQPELQGQGIGSSLMRHAERVARERYDAARIELQVISIRSELIAYYTRRGYESCGETKRFPYGEPRFGEPFRDDLEFVVLRKSLTDVDDSGVV